MTFSAMKFAQSSEQEAVPRLFSVTTVSFMITTATGRNVGFGDMTALSSVIQLHVDWGDGNSNDYTPSYDDDLEEYVFRYVSHYYSKDGPYVVTLSDSITSISLFREQSGSQTIWTSSAASRRAVKSILSVAPHLVEFSDGCAEGLFYLDVPDGVESFRNPGVSLGQRCFRKCTSLHGLFGLSKFVTSVSAQCFEGCTSLTSLTGASAFSPSAASCFKDCSSLTSIDGLGVPTSLGSEMFRACTSLSSLTGMPQSVLSLGAGCFAECTGLTTTSPIQSSSFTALPAGCFRGCTSLASIDNLKMRFTSYGDECFMGSGLTHLYPLYDFTNTEVVQSFGDRCFAYTPIASVNLKATNDSALTYVGNECFRGCSRLSSVPLFGWNVTELGEGVYRDCYEIAYNSDGLVTLERGISGRLDGLYGFRLDKVPAYMFYGDALISSLYGLVAPSPNMVSKTKLGHWCFSGCSYLKDLTGLAGITTSVDRRSTRLPDGLNLGDGVFSNLYFPPTKFLRDTPDGQGNRPYHYRGVKDVSALTSMSGLQVVPASTFEGCALIPDFPPVGAKTWWWGDRCFAGCRNLKTLDSLAAVEPNLDDVQIAGAYLYPLLPRFGAYCFSGCTWKGVNPKPKNDGSLPMIYDPDPQNPPTINSGLTRIGGLRVLVDKIEYVTLKKIPDVEGYLVDRWTNGVLRRYTDRLRQKLGSSSTDYYKWLSISDVTQYMMYEDRTLKPFDGITWAVLDGIHHASDYTFTHPSVPRNTITGGVSLFARTYIDGSGTLRGAYVDVGVLTAYMDGSDRVGSVKDVLFNKNQSKDEEKVIELDNGICLYLSGSTVESGEVLGITVVIDVRYEYTYTDGNGQSQQASLPVFTYSWEGEIELGEFDRMTPAQGSKKMMQGVMMYAVCSRALGDYSWIRRRWGSVSQFITFMSGSIDASLASDFKSALSYVTLETPNSILGEHCFEGCSELEVTEQTTTPQTLIDGFPSLIRTIPSCCFKSSGVSLTSAFKNVTMIGDGAFAGTPTDNLSCFPSGASFISDSCFSGCEDLTKFGNLRNGIQSIGSRSFDGCTELDDIRAKSMSSPDLDGSSDLGNIASPDYTEFVDKYAYCLLADSLGSHAFRGTAIESLTYEWPTITVGDTEAQKQAFAKFVFDGLFEVEVETVGRTDGSRTNKEFMFHLKADNGEQIVFRGAADISSVDEPGFDMDGRQLQDGCVSSIQFFDIISNDYSWYPPYTGSTVPNGLRYLHEPNAVYGTGFLQYDSDTYVRVFCPYLWYVQRSGTSRPHCSGDTVYLIVGPYLAQFQICLSAEITENGSHAVTDIDYEIAGVKCLSLTRITGSSGLDKVPVFPLLDSVGTGCFEGCTNLQSLDGLDRLYMLPSRCFAGCPFEHDVEDPTVIPPEATASMPALVTRRRFASNLISAVYLYKTSHRSNGVVDYVTFATGYSDTVLIRVDVSVVDGNRVYTVVSSDAKPVTYQDVQYTPHLESIDDEKVIIRLSSEIVVKIPTEWHDDSSYVSFGSTVLYSDSVASEMQTYLDLFSGSVMAGSGDSSDFVYRTDETFLSYSSTPVTDMISFSWSRTTGVWSMRMPVGTLTSSTYPTKSVMYTSVSEDGAVGFQCVGHDGWLVQIQCGLTAVKVVSRSVTIPSNVTLVGNDCFTFDKYPDVPKLEAVYFDHLSASTVRAMNGYPFGIPPGCSIYADGKIVYTEPLPSA